MFFHHLISIAVFPHSTCTVDIYLQIRACLHHASSTLWLYWWKRHMAKISLCPSYHWLCNPGTVIYSSPAVQVTAVPASVLNRNLSLPGYWFLRFNALAPPVVTMNKAFLPLGTVFLAELVTSSTASQKCNRISTVHCTGHQQADKVCSQVSQTHSWVTTLYRMSEVIHS